MNSTLTQLPVLKDVRDTLCGLLGRDVDLNPGATPPAVGGDSGSTVALYVDDSLTSRAVIVADFALTARMGAAIGLIPPGGADAAIEDRELPQSLSDNAYEVLNILASVFNVDGAPHLRLYAVSGPGDDLRGDVRAIALKQAPREDLNLTINRYGKGVMSIVLA